MRTEEHQWDPQVERDIPGLSLRLFWSRVLIAATLSLLPLCLINARINPYGFFDLSSQFLYHPKIAKNLRLLKPYHLTRAQPDAVIIGGSSAGRLPVDHPYWGKDKVYNAALPGGYAYEMRRLIQHAHHGVGTQKYLVSLDLINFRGKHARGFEERRHSITADNKNNYLKPAYYLKDLLSITASLDAIKASFNTHWDKKIDNRSTIYYNRDGSWDFQQEKYNIKNRTYKNLSQLVNHTRHGDITDTLNYQEFKDILRYAYPRDLDITFIFPPKHMRFFSALHSIDRTGSQHAWKKEILTLNEKIAQEYNRKPYIFYDFENKNVITAYDGFKSSDVFFWDGVHYNIKIGSYILDWINGDRENLPKNFAHTINKINMDSILREQWNDYEDYLNNNNHYIKRLKK